jgi:diketogulonate reductase-like aldo/keto reductase
MKAFPPIFYGTAWKKDKTADLVDLAIRSGFRAIDTACQPKHYNEAGVG